MIREKKLKKAETPYKLNFYPDQNTDENYDKLSRELDGIKLMLVDLKGRDL